MAEIKQKRDKEAEKYPVLYKINSGRAAQYFISVDMQLFEVNGNVTVALCSLMQTFFCFNIKYPVRGQAFYRLLETILGIKTLAKAPVLEKVIQEIYNVCLCD